MRVLMLLGSLILVFNLSLAHSPHVVESGTTQSKTNATQVAQRYFTDRLLVTQDEKEVRFYSDVLKDQIVVVNFIYTRCQDACPLTTKKLQQVQTLLNDSAERAVKMVSISTDPEWDTPERLKAFAKLHNADRNWLFLTGSKSDIDFVIQKLGQLTPSPESHSSLFLLGNVNSGHWIKMFGYASPEQIAEQLRNI